MRLLACPPHQMDVHQVPAGIGARHIRALAKQNVDVCGAIWAQNKDGTLLIAFCKLDPRNYCNLVWIHDDQTTKCG